MLTEEQRRKNRRTGLLLAAIALVFFLGVIVRKVWVG
ncbi:cytochrome oxidase small assembly protein [Pigmentiphaga soli]